MVGCGIARFGHRDLKPPKLKYFSLPGPPCLETHGDNFGGIRESLCSGLESSQARLLQKGEEGRVLLGMDS